MIPIQKIENLYSPYEIVELEQGSSEWLLLRKSKITATDAPVIMGASRWKTKIQLYNEKISSENNTFVNSAMKRGNDLEPFARSLFEIESGIKVKPSVIVKDWSMASLDGLSSCRKYIVEIKCPGEKDHTIALKGKVPDHYYPQIQHQIYVSNVEFSYYYSFDGIEGVTLKVERDDKYIERMIEEEVKFYECIQNKTPPELSENDYIERDDDVWNKCASKWKEVTDEIKSLEKQEAELRKQLIFLSGEVNTKGAGISLCQIKRKGNIEYSKIPELRGVDLEPYRKNSISSWRILSQ